MSKYLKLFETTSQYEAYMGGGEKILPNVSLIEETNKVEYNPYIPPRNDIIIYTASEKLNKTWSDETATFGATIKSHTFENGVGTIEFNDNVTTIGGSAFENCRSLTSIIIPNSVTSIGIYAFLGCISLTSITIPNSVTSIDDRAFDSCSSLTSITIPDSVTSIGYQTFYGCSGLTSITIPNSVTSISENAFQGCSNLVMIDVESGNVKYDSRDNCNAIVETVTNTLITGCQNTTIPNTVTTIGGSAFYECTSLTSITIPNSVTSIGEYAFSDCTNLTSITIPNSVTSIDSSTFQGCTKLTSITIPNSVTSISENAFQGCSNLVMIDVESGNTTYDSRDNCNAIVETATGTLIIGCQNTTIPNTVTSIGEYAFYNCSGLTSITIPDGVTSIGWSAFESCSSLTNVTVEATTPPTLESRYGSYGQFDNNASGRKIYVPSASVSTYQSASGWSDYANDIEAIPTA